MKPILKVSIVGGLILCRAVFSAFADDAAKSEAKTAWQISGELEEACSCHAACPCWFKSLPSRSTNDSRPTWPKKSPSSTSNWTRAGCA